jgi:hypothetical protein
MLVKPDKSYQQTARKRGAAVAGGWVGKVVTFILETGVPHG